MVCIKIVLKKFFLITVLLFNYLNVFSLSIFQNSDFVSLSMDDGLSNNTIKYIMMDSHDFVWICTDMGLCRYDGTNFETISPINFNENFCYKRFDKIYEDIDGMFWILSEGVLYKYDYIENKILYSFSGVISLCYDKEKSSLWAISDSGLVRFYKGQKYNICNTLKSVEILNVLGDSLFCYSKQSGVFQFDVNQNRIHIFNDNKNIEFSSAYKDKNGNLFVLSRFDGCYLFDKNSNKFLLIDDIELQSLLSGHANDINGDGNYIYFSTSYNGLVIYDRILKKIQNIKKLPFLNYNINDNNLSCVYIDKYKGLWLGTSESGVNYRSSFSSGFHYYNSITNKNGDLGTVGNFIEYGDYVYVATEGGLSRINIKNNEAESVNISNIPLNTFEVTGLKCMVKADKEHIWLAPHMRGLHLYNIDKNRIEKSIYYEPINVVKSMTVDCNGDLWIAGNGGVARVNKRNFSIESIPEIDNLMSDDRNVTFISFIDNQLYVSTISHGFFIYDINVGSVLHFSSTQYDWLDDNHITYIYKDKLNRLWIGTYTDGVLCLDSKYNLICKYTKDSIIGNSICGIIEDSESNIWVTTTKGLSKISSGGIISNFDKKNGFKIEKPFYNSIFFSEENQMLWIGGNNGLVYVYPRNMRVNMLKPRMSFSSIKVYNNNSLNNKLEKLVRNFMQKDYDIEIDYDNFPLNVNFCAINFTYPQKNLYAYKIDEVNDIWQSLGNVGKITIPSLSPGTYNIHISASNNDGIWNEDYLNLKIQVNPPIWLSWWAYVLYSVVIISLMIYFVREYKLRLHLKHENEINIIEMENEKKNFKEKQEFYTIFSHELRTPLTLIMDPIRELLSKTDPSSNQYALLQIMKKHSSRLLYIVNQLLDLRKIEEGYFNVDKKPSNFLSVIKDVMISFREKVKIMGIDLRLETEDDSLVFDFDEKLIETLAYNLLSNAVKNTPENGIITVDVRRADVTKFPDLKMTKFSSGKDFLIFSVINNGCRIPEEYIDQIFNPFFQVASCVNDKITGTGIGLYVCFNIMKLHDGILFARNSETKDEVTFTCVFPYITSPSVVNSEVSHKVALTDCFDEMDFFEDGKLNIENNNTENEIILVVEDNLEIQEYLKVNLGKYFQVQCCSNGKDALSILYSMDISVIISDIMMPVMNGLELCSSVKQDLKLSHIPIILLTALSEETNVINGLESNADAYITKPFSISLLLAFITNLQRKKRIMQKYFQANVVLGVNNETKTLDEKFIEDVYSYIDNNMDKTFSLDDMAVSLGISKVHLNRKIKALTSLTPAKLVQKHKFIKSKLLIEKGETSVTEIAYSCGFSDPIYFSKCFKQEFGMTPTEYMKNVKEQY